MTQNNEINKDFTHLVRMSDIKPRKLIWIWKPYIPLGKLTILRGDPGCGKTSFALQLAALYSRLDVLPGQTEDDIGKDTTVGGNVLFITAEDDLDDSVHPRLIAANANMDQIFSVEEGDKEGPFTFADPIFEELIEMAKPRLVIVDPIQAFIGAGVDGHRANEIRPIMAHLRKLARKHLCAIVLIEHLNKNTGGKPLYRGLGSIDTTAAVRSIMMLGSDENNPTEKGAVHIKSNVGQLGPVVGFSITDDGFKWNPDSTITKEAIFGMARNGDVNGQSNIDKACEFLTEVLKEDARTAKDLQVMAETYGISQSSLRRAREKLGIKSVRGTGNGNDIVYYWHLPGSNRVP